jgi:hypothetical protein
LNCPIVILENFVLKIYSESLLSHPELSSAQVSESFGYCHADNGGISVFYEKLSGKEVSFVVMTARGNCFTQYSVIVKLPICHPELFSYAE